MRKILIKSKFLFLILGLILAFNSTTFNCFAENRKLPIYGVETENPTIAISFDAAWGSDKTRSIMDICDDYGVKATFFLVGFWVEKNMELTKEIVDRGFEIGLHSSTHPDMAKLNTEKIREELTKNLEIIEKATGGYRCTLFRPPFGSYNNNLISVCEELNLYPIQWSVDSLDWKGLSAQEIFSRIKSKTKYGSIILCHNNSDNILPALKLIFEHFKDTEYRFVKIGDLIYKQDYHINVQGTQIKN